MPCASAASRAFLALLVLAALSACRSSGAHFSSRPWRAGFDDLTAHTEQWLPAALALGATPLFFIEDHSTSADSVEDQFFGSSTQYGDELALGLGLAPVALGGAVALASGDSGVLETSAEALALTVLETQFLKLAINRERPDGTTEDSFPSGHTSFAFAGATLLARWWQAEHEQSLLGYWLYLPATYVGISRLEGDRHFLSDISFGAALGIVTANWVWNAHFGGPDRPGLLGSRAATRLGPVVEEGRVGLALGFSF